MTVKTVGATAMVEAALAYHDMGWPHARAEILPLFDRPAVAMMRHEVRATDPKRGSLRTR